MYEIKSDMVVNYVTLIILYCSKNLFHYVKSEVLFVKQSFLWPNGSRVV